MFSYELQQTRHDDLLREAEQWRLAHRAATERRAQRDAADRRNAARTAAHTDTEGTSSPAAARAARRRSGGGHPAGLDRVRRVLHSHSAA